MPPPSERRRAYCRKPDDCRMAGKPGQCPVCSREKLDAWQAAGRKKLKQIGKAYVYGWHTGAHSVTSWLDEDFDDMGA